MKFSKKSEELMKYFLKYYDNFCESRTAEMQKTIDTILKIFYNDINLSNIYVDTLFNRKYINYCLTEITTQKDIPKTHLLSSKFIPKIVKYYIDTRSVGYYKLNILLSGVRLNLYFLLFKQSDYTDINFIEKRIKKALKIIKFCLLYMKSNTMDSLNLYLYLTPIEKELPKNQISVLSEDNCNSAVTYACQEKGELLVFREEEWEKVLIHELMHCMCLDFSGINYTPLKNEVKKIFDIKSDFEISEAYTEFWATIINTCMISYNLLKKKNDIETFLLYTEFCMQFEKIFSLFQCVKILTYMGLQYTDLYQDTPMSKSLRTVLYKENTNILAYYIIKLILLFNKDDFLNWCVMNNDQIISFKKTPSNIKKFGIFIKEKYDDSFLSTVFLRWKKYIIQ